MTGSALRVPVVLTLEQEAVADLERAFAAHVGEGVLFLPGLEEPEVGARVRAEVRTRGGEALLAVEGLVAWLYRASTLPEGREPGLGVLVERVEEACQERYERMLTLEDAGSRARPPGTRVFGGKNPFEPGHETVVDPGELRTADFVAVEDEARLLERRRAASAEPLASGVLRAAGLLPEPRPLPPPEGFVAGPLPRPSLEGAYFQLATAGGRRRLRFFERFAWPFIGTLRPSRRDIRTRAPWEPRSEEGASWEDVTDSDRRSPLEVSDPSRVVSDVVASARVGLVGIEAAIAAATRAPAAIAEDGEEATDTDVRTVRTMSSEGLGVPLPHDVVFVREGDEPRLLFMAGLTLPATTLVTVEGGAEEDIVEVALEERCADRPLVLGSARFFAPGDGMEGPARKRVELRVDVGVDGRVELGRVGDDELRRSFFLSFAAERGASGDAGADDRRPSSGLLRRLKKLLKV